MNILYNYSPHNLNTKGNTALTQLLIVYYTSPTQLSQSTILDKMDNTEIYKIIVAHKKQMHLKRGNEQRLWHHCFYLCAASCIEGTLESMANSVKTNVIKIIDQQCPCFSSVIFKGMKMSIQFQALWLCGPRTFLTSFTAKLI